MLNIISMISSRKIGMATILPIFWPVVIEIVKVLWIIKVPASFPIGVAEIISIGSPIGIAEVVPIKVAPVTTMYVSPSFTLMILHV